MPGARTERSEGCAVAYRGELTQILRFALSKITSFPRKRESTGLAMGPRFRGDDDADFHSFGWAAGPRVLGVTDFRETPAKRQNYILTTLFLYATVLAYPETSAPGTRESKS